MSKIQHAHALSGASFSECPGIFGFVESSFQSHPPFSQWLFFCVCLCEISLCISVKSTLVMLFVAHLDNPG